MEFGHIYVIENIINGEEYVGQTKQDLWERWRRHRNASRYDYDDNNKFYNSIRKYGEENFRCYSIHKCCADDLDEMEMWYIFDMDTKRNGLNSSDGGEKNPSKKGRSFSEEHRSNISKTKKGKPFSEEHKANISKAKKGKPFSEQHKANMKRDEGFSKEHKEKLSKRRKDFHDKNLYLKRKQLFSFYCEHINELTLKEMSKKLGYKYNSFKYYQTMDWWKEMEKEFNRRT